MDVRAAPSRNRNLLYQAVDGIPIKGSSQIVKGVKIAQVCFPVSFVSLFIIITITFFYKCLIHEIIIGSAVGFIPSMHYSSQSHAVRYINDAACPQAWDRDEGRKTGCGFCRQPYSGQPESTQESWQTLETK